MKTKKPDNLKDILESFSTRRIMVLGDIMLDQYLWGKVLRISPEAPVPIIEVKSEESRLGGAANVALNLAALGAQVELIGVCGKDSHAKTLKNLLKKHKLHTTGIFTDADRPTTLKTRIGAASQQIVRIDMEDTTAIRTDLARDIVAYIERLLPVCDALIIEDYEKGLLGYEIINEVLHLCRKWKVIVAVDPKLKNFNSYHGVEIFKPNFGELQSNFGKELGTEEDFYKAAQRIRQLMKTKCLVVTRGGEGMYVFGDAPAPKHLATFVRKVVDVSGAGDTVISALCLAYLYQRDIETAALIANHAAAVVVAKHGTSVASVAEIWESFDELG